MSGWRLAPTTSVPISARPITLVRRESRSSSLSTRVVLVVLVALRASRRSGAASANVFRTTGAS